MTRREYFEDRHEELRESGLCLDCGNVPVDRRETLCEGCKHYRRWHFHLYKGLKRRFNPRFLLVGAVLSEDKAKLGSK